MISSDGTSLKVFDNFRVSVDTSDDTTSTD